MTQKSCEEDWLSKYTVNIQYLVDQFCSENHMTPYTVNDGSCEDFASFAKERLPGLKVYLVGDEIMPRDEEDFWFGHIWMEIDGRHYDAEAPEGVDNPIDLPLFKKRLAYWQKKGYPLPSVANGKTLYTKKS